MHWRLIKILLACIMRLDIVFQLNDIKYNITKNNYISYNNPSIFSNKSKLRPTNLFYLKPKKTNHGLYKPIGRMQDLFNRNNLPMHDSPSTFKCLLARLSDVNVCN